MTITSKRKTEIVETLVDRMLSRVQERAERINEDGGMPGDIALPGRERLDAYWAMTPDLTDLPLLIDPDWELRIRQGLDQPPVNPYWKNTLSIPGMLKRLSHDFMSLNERYADEALG